jgi:hypothetical protein
MDMRPPSPRELKIARLIVKLATTQAPARGPAVQPQTGFRIARAAEALERAGLALCDRPGFALAGQALLDAAREFADGSG